METRYEMGSNGAPICHNFIYHYDNSGVSGFSYKGQNYYFLKNLQGDVTEIYRQDGTLVGQYIYDAWGNHTIVTDIDGIASLNPFRYRGYYYDVETGLYYVKSRYYDPKTGRFINADGYVSTGQDLDGFNMYAYCGNNPINRFDDAGCCYYNANGVWSHDNWEYIGGYERKPAPVDITEKLDNAMKENAEALSEYQDEHDYIDTVTYFVDKVKPGGDWDFKSQEEWALDPNTTYIYNDTELRYDDIGNIHYGYVGRVIFGSNMLLLAGGAVQIYTGTSKWYYWQTNFDDPRDQWAIQYGCYLWDTEAVS